MSEIKTAMKVDFMKLPEQHSSIKKELLEAFERVITHCRFASGPEVEKFEKEFASYCQAEYGIGVNSGTSALLLALLACGVDSTCEVITVPNTFIATVEAISFTGAKPVFVDVEEDSFNIDPTKLEAAITPKTKAIIGVHLFGQPFNFDPILEIALRHNLILIEDAAQAAGSHYKGKMVGSLGDAACFSFYPSKNLGCCGEGGFVTTNNQEIAKKVKMLRDHGQEKKYYHQYIGLNGRMDAIQGAVLSVKLKKLDDWNERRRELANHYDELLKDTQLLLPKEMLYGKHIYHLYVVRHPERDKLLDYLAKRGVSCGIHYPIPLHLQKAYSGLGYKKGDFPVAEKTADEFLSLPLYPELTDEEQSYVVSCIKDFFQA